ncbi:MAG: PAS domain S-box protein [Candidatus Aminicenantes bacterium]|nr:PAS domain S-box protein [Candidatus Aminicenantes bacterium]
MDLIKKRVEVIMKDKDQLLTEVKELRTRVAELEKEETERKKAEKELNAANQQLDASNQQLRASEQQLKAANQQLRASEKELLKSKETAESYLNVAAEIIISLDSNGKITLLNESGHKLLGYKKGELIGKNWFTTCVPEKLRTEVRKVFKKLMKGEVENVALNESPVVTKTGKEKTILWHNSLLRNDDGKIIGTLSSGEDITKRKLAEEQLQENEKNFRDLVNNLLDGVAIADENAYHIYVNPKFSEITGYGKDELLNMTGWDFTRPQDLPKLKQRMKDRMAGKPIKTHYERIIVRKDGTEAPVEMSTTTTIWQGKKRPMAIIRDISQRKKSEKALKESEERYRTLFETVAEGILIADLGDKKFKYANPSICRMLGYESKELLAMGVEDIHPKESLDHVISEFQAQARGEKTLAPDIPCLRKDGSILYANISTKKAVIDGEQCNVGFFTDITKRKQAETALKESEEKFRTITENSADAIFITDQQGNYQYVNKEACEMLGYSKEELTEMSIADLSRKEPVDESPNIFKQILKTGRVFTEIELRKKDGNYLPTDLNTVVLPNGLVYGSCRDITIRKKAETQLQKSLKEKNVMLQEIHHRVKNNMQIISSLLNLQSQNVTDKKALESFQTCRERIKAMALIHESLYESQNLAEVDFSNYVKKMTTHLYASHRTLSDRVNLSVDIDQIFLDVNRAIPAGLIINELVSNAFTHGFPEKKKGSVSIKIKAEGKDSYSLEVADTGVGLPKSYDWKNPITLGLKLVTDLVKQIDGTLTISQKKGTVVRIKF